MSPSDALSLAQIAIIHALRETEGAAVTILSDNPDGPPNCAVEVCSDRTDWKTRRYSGATITEALLSARDDIGGVEQPGPTWAPITSTLESCAEGYVVTTAGYEEGAIVGHVFDGRWYTAGGVQLYPVPTHYLAGVAIPRCPKA